MRLDQRAIAIVQAASPFGYFSAEMLRGAEILVITSRFPLHPRRRPGHHAGRPVPIHDSQINMPWRAILSSTARSPTIPCCFSPPRTDPTLEYGRLLPIGRFRGPIRRFAAEGNKGCNVTVPFKFEAYKLAKTLTPRAQLAQAVNTLRFDADGWAGDNTDGVGLVRDIRRNAGRPLKGLSVLLIGAGGAAAGVLGSLIEAGPGAHLDRQSQL